MSLAVVGTGLSRTGTTTIRKVIEELGLGPCYNSSELFTRPRGIEFWDALEQKQNVDFDKFFTNYNAIIGFPGYIFHKELKEKYPDAKVILSVRDPGDWYDDISSTVFESGPTHVNQSYAGEVREFDPYLAECIERIHGLQKRILEDSYFEGRFEDKDYAVNRYVQWSESIIDMYDDDELLVYSVFDGWEPICEFLNVPVPKDKPFPHLNDPDTFHNRSTSGFLDMLKKAEGR